MSNRCFGVAVGGGQLGRSHQEIEYFVRGNIIQSRRTIAYVVQLGRSMVSSMCGEMRFVRTRIVAWFHLICFTWIGVFAAQTAPWITTFGEWTIQEGLLLKTKTGHTISIDPLHIENLISLGKIPLRQSLQLAAVPRGEPLSRDFCAV